MKIKERVAYLQGLTQGLNVNAQSAEGKLLVNIVNVLEDMAEEFDHIHLQQQDLENYMESMDEDLSELENEVYDEEGSGDFIDMQCPSCCERVTFNASVLSGGDSVEITCPQCGATVYETTMDAENISVTDERDTSGRMRYGLHPGV